MRSASSRSRSVSEKSTYVIASAIAVVTSLFADESNHLVGDASITRMSLGARAQFDEVHGLAGVHLHHVANPKGQGDRVLGLLGELFAQVVVEVGRASQRLLVALGEARLAR